MSNFSDYCDRNFTHTIPNFTVSFGFYIGLGVLGNLVAFILLLKQSKFHKWKVFYRFVLMLVCVDLAGIVIFSCISIIESPLTKWADSGSLCNVESILISFISLTNLFVVTFIAIERFLALWHPYFYSSVKGHPLAMLSPVAIVIVTAVLASLALTQSNFVKIYPCNFCFINIYSKNYADYIFAFVYIIIGLVLVAVAIVMNILVAIALSRGQRGYSRQRESRIYITNDKRDYCGMLFQIGAAIAEVAVCWIPIMIRMLITMTGDETSEKDIKNSYLFFRFASWALVVDPWIYVLLRREIIMNICIFFQRQQRPRLTSSGDAVERKSNDERKSLANDEKRASYGTI